MQKWFFMLNLIPFLIFCANTIGFTLCLFMFVYALNVFYEAI